MSQQSRSTFVLGEANEILQALVGLKDVRVLQYRRHGPDVELMIEQVVEEVRCPGWGGRARVKERPVVRYVDLPVYGTPMRLAWKKHRSAVRGSGEGSHRPIRSALGSGDHATALTVMANHLLDG